MVGDLGLVKKEIHILGGSTSLLETAPRDVLQTVLVSGAALAEGTRWQSKLAVVVL